MKHIIVTTKQGYARRKNRGKGIIDWAYLFKKFPAYQDHIFRIRKNQYKLVKFVNKVLAKKLETK